MAIIFYPQEDVIEVGSMDEKLEALLSAAERYRAIVLDAAQKYTAQQQAVTKKGMVPRDISSAFNWDALAAMLRQVRELPESAPSTRLSKAMKLEKLAEVYEVLRGAKMPRLEAVRLALMNEAGQLRGPAGTGQT